MQQMNFFFGPKLPIEFEHIGLAFIAAPTLRPDTSIGSLSAVRYAQQNYDHVEVTNIFQEGVSLAKLDVMYFSPQSSGLSGTLNGLVSTQGRVTLEDNSWGPTILNSAIKVAGMRVTQAETWYPIIKSGVVWRPGYVLAASGIEPSGSWLKRALDPNSNITEDKKLILVYSIPEVLYNITSSGSLSFPSSGAKYISLTENVLPINPHVIGYDGDIHILKSIKVNDNIIFQGTYTGVEVSSSISFLDRDAKQIGLRSALAPDDQVIITYLSYNDFYIYSGFRDYLGNWWPFDANPEYGHVIGNEETAILDLSSDALLRQVTLYAIPSAAIEYKYTENPDGSPTLGTLELTAHRAINYGETHFVRHLISSEPIEFIDSRSDGTIINTWGHAVFGRNFYDEETSYGGDVFNLKVPSMIPLGRFVMGAPASLNSVSMADIRQRGGGVPEDFPMVAVESQENGLDKLRGFYDLGIWEGKAVKEGGVVIVKINQSLLKTDPEDTDPTTFLASEIYDIVKSNVPPGVLFEIQYVENV